VTFDPTFIFYRDDREIYALETLGDMAKEAEAELATRIRLYPGMIQKGRLARADADRELRVMGAIADDLTGKLARAGAELRGTATWTDRILCLRREILIRRADYPRYVERGLVDQATADRRLRILESIHDMTWHMTWSEDAIAARAATERRAAAA
jgi:hypothetical protein